MKLKYFISLTSAAMLFSLAQSSQVNATVNGSFVDFPDVRPMMVKNRVMVPVRGVFEKMDANVTWDYARQCVMAQKGSTSIELPINSFNAIVNEKTLPMDVPAMLYNNRAMVPLRFISEAMDAQVNWVEATQTVEITTIGASLANYSPNVAQSGTVLPFTLNNKLSSRTSRIGDKFTAKLDTGNSMDYQYIPKGSIIMGHVNIVKARNGDKPGVLGLAFDAIKLPDGQRYNLKGSLIGLDEKSIENRNGKLVAKNGKKGDNLKYVGIGAGAGALIAIITKGNVVSNTLLGSALGYVAGLFDKKSEGPRDVNLKVGTKAGIRLDRDLKFRSNSKIESVLLPTR